MAFDIRRADVKDFDKIIALAQLVAEEPDAFLFDETYTEEELGSQWLPEASEHAETFVLEASGPRNGGILGVYVLHPAAHGRGSHIAHGLYMVHPDVRGRGYGKALCNHSVSEARKRGFQGMRINMVVASNFAAQRVAAACGFRVLCVLPRAFQHPARGLVDTVLLFNDLSCDGLAAPVPRRTVAAVASASRPCSQSPSNVPAAISAVVSAGSEVHLQPCGAPDSRGGTVKYEVEPPLPPGLTLNPATGTISGQPVAAAPERSYCIKAISSTELVLRVDEPEVEEPEGDVVEKVSINEDFATQLEAVTQIENMLPEPPKIRGSYGDWMIWMVHRAHLDDPTLVEFNFGNMHMPPAHLEPRIAPKLVDAMGRNTHIEVLTLSNSNLQKAQGVELAGSLRKNQTVKSVNLECNWLDSNAVRELAVAIKDNPESSIEHLRFSHQKQMGQFFGRPTEEAVGQMMWRNESIVKLGFECDDAHWRNIIDRSLLRNNDFWRKRHAPPDPEALPTAEEHPLGHIRLLQVPEALSKEVLSKYPVLCEYLDNNLKMPTTLQLQNCAKNSGLQLSYTVAAPMIKEFRSWMIDKALGQQVTVFDVFNTSIHGILRRWSSEHDNWAVEIGTEEGKRCTFRSSKDPAVSVSEQWVDWLRSGKQIGWAQSRAGA